MSRVLYHKCLGYDELQKHRLAFHRGLELDCWDSEKELSEKAKHDLPDVVIFSSVSTEIIKNISEIAPQTLTMLHQKEELDSSNFVQTNSHCFNDLFSTIHHLDDLYFRCCNVARKSYRQHYKTPTHIEVVFENDERVDARFIHTTDSGVCITTNQQLPTLPANLICRQGAETLEGLVCQVKWSHSGPANNYFCGLDFVHISNETKQFLNERQHFTVLSIPDLGSHVWIEIHGDFSALSNHDRLVSVCNSYEHCHLILSQIDLPQEEAVQNFSQFLNQVDGNIHFHRCNANFVENYYSPLAKLRRGILESRLQKFNCPNCQIRCVRLIDSKIQTLLAESSSDEGYAMKCVTCHSILSPAPI